MKGHLEQRGDSVWTAVIELGRDTSGRRVRRRYTFHGAKRQAEKELTRLLRELDTGTYVDGGRMAVSEYLEQWLRDYVHTNVAPRTSERYEQIVRLHLVPALGHHALSQLKPLHIAAYYAESLRTGRKDGKGGLSAQTVLHHHRVLREALNQAVRWQLLARNPADAVEPPKPERQQMQVLDEKQTIALLASLEDLAFTCRSC